MPQKRKCSGKINCTGLPLPLKCYLRGAHLGPHMTWRPDSEGYSVPLHATVTMYNIAWPKGARKGGAQ